ncbi:MAG: hypothetical protein KF768_05185 [Phycisphaeraceae bacterium]|nr:hypothetical protein [Phycisphaeraceae bacterium]
MNLQAFLEHWKIHENPFRGEEARQDPVFLRLEGASRSRRHATERPGGVPNGATTSREATGESPGDAGPGASAQGVPHSATHADFEKIIGQPDRPSTSIVFGEKGSGKTAIRIQIADRIATFNTSRPDARCLLVAYDDLNPILDRFIARVDSERKPNPAEALSKFRLVDHIDGLLSIVVPRMIDTLLKERQDDDPLDLGHEPRKTIRRADAGIRQELLLLQSLYDRPEGSGGGTAGTGFAAAITGTVDSLAASAAGGAEQGSTSDRSSAGARGGSDRPGGDRGGAGGGGAAARTRRLRRVLRLKLPTSAYVWASLAYIGWVVPAALIGYELATDRFSEKLDVWAYLAIAAVLVYLLAIVKRSVWDRLTYLRIGHRVRRQLRVIARSDISYARSLRQIDAALLDPAVLPVTSSDDQRYAMLERLRRVLRRFGYASMIVVMDRVDEPTLISGDPDRMRSVVWPMFNNKFLQHPGMGVKMLLPMELRHALFRESAAFFHEARLDKQNMIERLTWSGPMLYDLCNARVQACRPAGATPISLLDLFAEDVSRQDLIESLEHMHQPRDAFKMLYQCLIDHCASVTDEQAVWRIPRHILENARKSHSDRLQQFQRGVRPA